jgi:hypothetical protein
METHVENHKKQRKTAENDEIYCQGPLFGLVGADFSVFFPNGVLGVLEWIDRVPLGGIGTPREHVGII